MVSHFEGLLVAGFVAHDVIMDAGPFSEFGGEAGNVAVLARRMGIQVSLLTAFGNDEISSQYKRYLQDLDIDLSLSRDVEAPLTRCVMWNNPKKCSWQPGSGREIGIENISPDRLQFRWTHICHSSTRLIQDLIETNPGGTMSFNPGFGLQHGDIDPHLCIRYPWEFLFLNQQEMEILERAFDMPYERLFLNKAIKHVLYSRGPLDLLFMDNSGWAKIPISARSVKDPRGAGDALAAGVIMGRMEGYSLSDAIQIGIMAASVVVGSPSCQPEISRKDVLPPLP